MRGRSARRERAAAALLLGMVALLTACSQGERKEQADRIRDSVPRVAGRAVTGTLALDIRIVDAGPGNDVGVRTGGPLGTVTYAADPASRRTTVRAKAGEPPAFLAVDRSLYARRTTKSLNERRPWIRVDLERLNDVDVPGLPQLVEKSGPGDVTVVSPQLMLDLLAGVLTGSLQSRGTAADGTSTYHFNVSVDKADRVLRRKDDERDDRKKILRSLAITDDIHEGEADLRPDGSLARLKITFTERPDKQTVLALGAVLSAEPAQAAGTPAGLDDTPARATTIRVATLGDIRGAVSERLRPGAGLTLPQLPSAPPAAAAGAVKP